MILVLSHSLVELVYLLSLCSATTLRIIRSLFLTEARCHVNILSWNSKYTDLCHYYLTPSEGMLFRCICCPQCRRIRCSSYLTQTKLMICQKFFIVVKSLFVITFVLLSQSPSIKQLGKTFHLMTDAFIICKFNSQIALEFFFNQFSTCLFTNLQLTNTAVSSFYIYSITFTRKKRLGKLSKKSECQSKN